ncbi:DUF7557 family protein [Halapricum hydrolyticum]|uniref:Antitoxin VapB family protein n=1 Tax=Halapricum hydrolyticum TaxID=2979991 RepID=A0AAE3I929_9EURY|nr:hypothetical protein [Halapricum hydrolyticum]MCU4717169.1 antitoxin VapB family protein [Halapricum hydrolyticum]MCU4726096.1 antitoxin VapB family protein [Halapricum hydrolyticum]
MATIEVSDDVYEVLEKETEPGESIDDLLARVLKIDTERAQLDDSGVDSGDVHGGTNMWTVYDQLGRERKEGESLSDTFRRLQG